MIPRCIVSDLDRTLTDAKLVLDDRALERIRKLRASGIRFVIATGRRLEELEALGLRNEVDGLVAENGAVVCLPGSHSMEVRHADFRSQAQRALGPLAERFTWGSVMGSGPRELALVASGALVEGGIAHTLEYNAEELMILPYNVNKASGAQECLKKLGLNASDAWAVGDGENDVVLLRWARLGAAPANAAPATRAVADRKLIASYSLGFLEFTDALVAKEGVTTA